MKKARRGVLRATKKNPDKKKVGCMVPLCSADFCTPQRKKFCALRRYFLEHQKALREAVSGMEELNHYVYYWKEYNARIAEQENNQKNREVDWAGFFDERLP